MNLIKVTPLQFNILFADRFVDCVVNDWNSGLVARAIQRRISRLTGEVDITQADVRVLNRVTEVLRFARFRNPFSGGGAFQPTHITVTAEYLKDWAGIK